MTELHIPDAAVPYILLQRTGLQRLNPQRYRVLRRLPLRYEESALLSIESRLRAAAIKADFTQSVSADYAGLRPHLPASVGSVLDVGCGVAGIDALLYRHYKNQPDLYLLDRTQTDKAAYTYGMGAVERFYNSLELAQSLLIDNGVKREQITLMEAVPGFTLPEVLRFDLVISLISWGYHYPVETYLDQVYDALNPGGYLILDVRKGHNGENLLKSKFGNLDVLYKDSKQVRCLMRRE